MMSSATWHDAFDNPAAPNIDHGARRSPWGHPDHSMASICATMAFHWAAQKDLYPEQLDGRLPRQAQKLYDSAAPFLRPNRSPVSPPPCSATIDIQTFIEDKIRAFQAHTTQDPWWKPYAKAMRLFGGKELLPLAAADQPIAMETETDLLNGLSERERTESLLNPATNTF